MFCYRDDNPDGGGNMLRLPVKANSTILTAIQLVHLALKCVPKFRILVTTKTSTWLTLTAALELLTKGALVHAGLADSAVS